jgi:type IV secretory pathway VirB9-like protein
MKPLIPLVVSAGLALASAASHATEPHPLQPNAPRTVTVSEADTPPVIRAGLLQSTLIVLPAEEKVANVFAGDTVDWLFDGGHVASRFISVKPKVANSSTDVHIVSDHGNEYTLQLHEVSSDQDPHFDSKVFIAPSDQAAKDRLAQLPVFVPVAELDKAKQEPRQQRPLKRLNSKPRRPKLSSTAASTLAPCTLITPGTSQKEKPLALRRFGATTNSHTCAASSRKRQRSTR